jgi:hypothetical protein
MASSIYLNPSQRSSNGLREKGRPHSSLPIYYPSAVQEKFRSSYSGPWLIPVFLTIPGVRPRRIRLVIPNVARAHQYSVSRFGPKKGSFVLCFALLTMLFATFALAKRFGTEKREWPKLMSDPPTLVFTRHDLQRIWNWEVQSGHYPSSRKSEQLLLRSERSMILIHVSASSRNDRFGDLTMEPSSSSHYCTSVTVQATSRSLRYKNSSRWSQTRLLGYQKSPTKRRVPSAPRSRKYCGSRYYNGAL